MVGTGVQICIPRPKPKDCKGVTAYRVTWLIAPAPVVIWVFWRTEMLKKVLFAEAFFGCFSNFYKFWCHIRHQIMYQTERFFYWIYLDFIGVLTTHTHTHNRRRNSQGCPWTSEAKDEARRWQLQKSMKEWFTSKMFFQDPKRT
jgi:hypothetical protein